MESFFTFSDRTLRYDCPSCGSFCCKGKGIALEARDEVVRFARLEPRMASLVHPLNAHLAHVLDVTDASSMLTPHRLPPTQPPHPPAPNPPTSPPPPPPPPPPPRAPPPPHPHPTP